MGTSRVDVGARRTANNRGIIGKRRLGDGLADGVEGGDYKENI